MAGTFHLSVLTPEKSVLDQDVAYVHVPGMAGYMGILPNHAALISALSPGEMTVRDAGGTETIYAISGGFLEVSDNEASVLADAMEKRAEIDTARAEKAKVRAEERLVKASADVAVDTARARASLARAVNRIKVSKG